MNSGLYLVLLLHLYEQRFAELMRRNYNRVVRERVSVALTRAVRQQSLNLAAPFNTCAIC